MPGRTCVILQPSYLPWLGFFDLIDQADEFVFLDSVQFCKRSWDQRNRINGVGGYAWLTVPVKQSYGQMINETMIEHEVPFVRKHLGRIWHTYHKTEYFEDYYPDIRDAIQTSGWYQLLSSNAPAGSMIMFGRPELVPNIRDPQVGQKWRVSRFPLSAVTV